MKHPKSVGQLAAFVLGFAQVANAQLQIDAFTDPSTATVLTATSASPTPAAIDINGLSDVIGGRRIIDTTWESGTAGPTVSAVVDPNAVGGPEFAANSDTGQNGLAEISWPISVPVDLTTGGAAAFQYITPSNDNGGRITFTITDSLANTSTNIFTMAPLNTGTTTVPFAAFSPTGATAADFTSVTLIKVRINTAVASDISMRTILTDQPEDFGDAPDSYHTLEASDGPRHFINWVGQNPTGPLLGATNFNVDNDFDGSPSTGADGDDLGTNLRNPRDDESGLSNVSLFAGAADSSFDIAVTGATGFVNA